MEACPFTDVAKAVMVADVAAAHVRRRPCCVNWAECVPQNPMPTT